MSKVITVRAFNQCLNNHPPVGAKIKFAEEKQSYTVRASNTAYAVCTKPFNARKTVLYCVVDLVRQERGPEDLVFGYGAETDEECKAILERITHGETQLSYRRSAPLNIEWIKFKHG